jgi:dTMP kinase
MQEQFLGLFITFEGGEGCGKSFQSKVLYHKLHHLGIPAVLTYEPGGTVLGDQIRHLLKRKHQEIISQETELFLFFACRVQLVDEVIRPSLEKGKVVICDRFADSTIVYQGYGRGIDLKFIENIHAIVTRGIKPDLTVLLDMPSDEGLSRKRAKSRDRFEEAGLIFHNRIRDGYLKLAADEPERWLVIDATLPRIKISNIVWDRVRHLLASKQNITKHD